MPKSSDGFGAWFLITGLSALAFAGLWFSITADLAALGLDVAMTRFVVLAVGPLVIGAAAGGDAIALVRARIGRERTLHTGVIVPASGQISMAHEEEGALSIPEHREP